MFQTKISDISLYTAQEVFFSFPFFGINKIYFFNRKSDTRRISIYQSSQAEKLTAPGKLRVEEMSLYANHFFVQNPINPTVHPNGMLSPDLSLKMLRFNGVEGARPISFLY